MRIMVISVAATGMALATVGTAPAKEPFHPCLKGVPEYAYLSLAPDKRLKGRDFTEAYAKCLPYAVGFSPEAMRVNTAVAALVFRTDKSRNKSKDGAIKLMQPAFSAGTAYSAFIRAEILFWGAEDKTDRIEAHSWYLKAAEKGHRHAMIMLGYYAEGGYIAVENNKEALEWYRRAAAAGDPEGYFKIGVFYERGIEVNRDLREAMRWYRKGAELGDAASMHNLGGIFDDGPVELRDAKQAFDWYRRSAEAGYGPAMVNLGWMYRNGKGTYADTAKAEWWYLRAGQDGQPEGYHNLAGMYLIGSGGTVDHAIAAEHYFLAAKMGYGPSMLRLARLLIGEEADVRMDPQASLFWFEASQHAEKKPELSEDDIQAMSVLAKAVGRVGASKIKQSARAWKQGQPLPPRFATAPRRRL